MTPPLLISHHLCPYVQRAAIVAREKGVPIERRFIDLSAKPDWFLAVSPTGKVPVLQVTDAEGRLQSLFESAAIAEYLDEVGPGARLMPDDPIERARTRAWVDFASGTLNDIAGLYGAGAEQYGAKVEALRARFAQLEAVVEGPWFAGAEFGLVDAAFGPVFRYLDLFERAADLWLADGLPKVAAWRAGLAARPSVAAAVEPDYPERLLRFMQARGSHLTSLLH